MTTGSYQIESNNPELRHVLEILRKHYLLIVLITALTFLLSLTYVQLATPVYRAKATLIIEPQRASVVSIEELIGIDSETDDYYNTQFQLLQSRSLAKLVISTLDLWEYPELMRDSSIANTVKHDVIGKLLSAVNPRKDSQDGAKSAIRGTEVVLKNGDDAYVDEDDLIALTDRRERIVDRFLERLKISPKDKTKLVEIKYESSDPAVAAEVVNTLSDQYISSYLDTRLSRTARAADWLGSKVSELGQILAVSEQKLLNFKRGNGLVDFGGGIGRLNEQELILATSELASARLELADVRRRFLQVQSFKNNLELLLTVPAVQLDPLLQRVKLEEVQASRSLETLLNRYGPKHPEVIDAQSTLDAIRLQLQSNAERVANSVESELIAAQQRFDTVENKIISGKRDLQLIGEKSFDLEALEREVQTNLEVYEAFYSRMIEARSAKGFDVANASVSDKAVAPEKAVKPRKFLICLLSSLVALMLTSFVVFVRGFIDDTIDGTSDVYRKLQVAVLGVVPSAKRSFFSRNRSKPIRPDQISDPLFHESINAIRTTLTLTDRERLNQIIVVTSSLPGEGKSSLSLNLAFSFGQMEKVLIIDGDLRRPTLERPKGGSVGGLSLRIAGLASFEESIIKNRYGNAIDVMPAGPATDMPLELLHSASFEAVLTLLRKKYNRIIIDGPPISAVSDSLVLAKLADATIFVIKAHKTPIEVVKRCIQRLTEINVSVAGIVVTQIKARLSNPDDWVYQYSSYHHEPGKKASIAGEARLVLSPEQWDNIRGK